MSELNTDQINIEVTNDGKIIVEPEYIEFLRTQGYPINDVVDIQTCDSESRDITHLIYTIQTTQYPTNHPKLDVIDDEITLRICTCEDMRYNQSVDVSERVLADASMGSCKHIRSEYRAEKAQQDNNQETLQ